MTRREIPSRPRTFADAALVLGCRIVEIEQVHNLVA
jgi:hypothetical protein